ncbi:MAG: hypothetical protein PGN26_03865 [Xylophilus ampelinus]
MRTPSPSLTLSLGLLAGACLAGGGARAGANTNADADAGAVRAAEAPAAACALRAGPGCYRSFAVPGSGGTLPYYASLPEGAAPVRLLIGVHGHPRDAGRTFDALLQAARNAGRAADTLVVAPVFPVADADAAKCRAPGTPSPAPGDLRWTCASWIDGGLSAGERPVTSFAALDALMAEAARRWPSVRSVTVAGFSAGAQMVQHAIGFARPPAGLPVRYVVADPGSWLYFDPVPGADAAACPGANRWKYGTEGLPAALGRGAAEARARYAAADIAYLAGALDDGDRPGAFYRILDKSCAAEAQGPARLQRATAYADYDRAVLAPAKPRSLAVVPGCAHDVACVFPSEAARPALFGAP